MSEHALRPCPFCGSARGNIKLLNRPSVECPDCLSLGPASARLVKNEEQNRASVSAAFDLWNTRPLEQELLAACKNALAAMKRVEWDENSWVFDPEELEKVIARAEATEGRAE